jgi:2-polyprenyl-3-methyl-5-hydroxy-6-metoxy-1,4-benzoquinol methylase
MKDTQYIALEEQYSGKQGGYYEMERAEMLPFIPGSASSVLEVGCSSGAFGGLIKKTRSGVVVWGIEPNPEAVGIATGRLDNVICGIFQSSMPELEGKKFDCIVFNDVLEHLVDPEQALIVSKEYLTAGGTVVASIPNILFFYQMLEILIEQDWRYRDSGILDNTHLRFFTKKSIIRMFEKCGFEISTIEGISASYGLKYRLINLLTLGHIKSWKFVQFAIQAKPLEHAA